MNPGKVTMREPPEFNGKIATACFFLGGIVSYIVASAVTSTKLHHLGVSGPLIQHQATTAGLISVGIYVVASLIPFGLAALRRRQSRYIILYVSLIALALPGGVIWFIPLLAWAIFGRRQEASQ
jgi:hypothetical protein